MADTASLIRDLATGSNASGLDISGNSSDGGDSAGRTLNASDSVVDSTDILGSEGNEVDVAVESGSPRDSGGSKSSTSGGKSPGKQAAPTSGDKEIVTVTDEKGQRKIEIDYTNRQSVKQAHLMAAGFRKTQAERDALQREMAPIREKYEQMQSNWDTLENVHKQRGLEGVIDLLEGRQGAYKDHLKKALDRQNFISRASPEELDALQARESAESHKRELEQIRKENEDFRKQMTEQKETAEIRATESKIHPAFDKYRFADKLGDSQDEHMFDQMLWRTAMDRLAPYEEQYGSATQIPQEIIDKEFRTVAGALRNRISSQAGKTASRVIEQKKQEATENVQNKVQSGYKTGGARKEAEALMNQGAGGINKIFQNWGKFGSSFSRK